MRDVCEEKCAESSIKQALQKIKHVTIQYEFIFIYPTKLLQVIQWFDKNKVIWFCLNNKKNSA